MGSVVMHHSFSGFTKSINMYLLYNLFIRFRIANVNVWLSYIDFWRAWDSHILKMYHWPAKLNSVRLYERIWGMIRAVRCVNAGGTFVILFINYLLISCVIAAWYECLLLIYSQWYAEYDLDEELQEFLDDLTWWWLDMSASADSTALLRRSL